MLNSFGRRLIVVVRQAGNIVTVLKILLTSILSHIYRCRLLKWIYSAHCFVPPDGYMASI